MENKTYRIQEIGEVVGGGTPSTKIAEYWGEEIPWISPADLSGYNKVYIERGEKNISKLGLIKSSTVLLPPNTVLLTSRAPIGYLALAKNSLCTNQGFKNIICNPKIVDYKYLYYYLKQNIDYIKLFSSGATFPEISGNRLKRIKITIEENVVVQNKIASILSSYDELIETNNKRIKLLEQMAENLYKEWFVRFRFPGYEEESFKESLIGKIPQSFNVVKMKKVLLYYIGGGWGEDEKTATFSSASYVIRGTDFVDIQKGKWLQCPYRYHKESNFNSRKLNPWDIILEVSGGTQEQPVGRTLIVTPELIEYMSGKVICASFCKLLRCNEEVVSPLYFYYWMQYLYNTRIIDKFQLQSTGIINFKFEYFLRKGDIMIPSKKIMSEFEHKVKEIYKLKDSLAKQNQNLVKQRDLLLPRLMSGKLEV